MTVRKLLMYFSYLGTNYRGLQVLNTRRTLPDLKTVHPEYDTVQGVLEQGLRKVLQIPNIIAHTSSRTDSGVHALSSTVHFKVDDNAFETFPFSPERICQSLNYYLENNQTDIRIQRIVEVPSDFHCRRAYSRTYNYRIALAKDNNDLHNCYSLSKLSPLIPIPLVYQVQVVPQPFDVGVVQQACRMFLGTWNFRSFATLTKSNIQGVPGRPDSRPITEEDLTKTVYRFSFSKTSLHEDPDIDGYYSHDPTYRKFDLYDFHIEASGFLRRQVRRMIGTLLALGRESIQASDIFRLLEYPHEKYWPSQATASKPEGLYLKSVNYKDLEVLRGYLSN